LAFTLASVLSPVADLSCGKNFFAKKKIAPTIARVTKKRENVVSCAIKETSPNPLQGRGLFNERIFFLFF
jgi:hypothetical protein